jgi:hypothetical protein
MLKATQHLPIHCPNGRISDSGRQRRVKPSATWSHARHLDVGGGNVGYVRRIAVVFLDQQKKDCWVLYQIEPRIENRELSTENHSRGQGSGARDQERCGFTTPHLIRQPAQWFCPPL